MAGAGSKNRPTIVERRRRALTLEHLMYSPWKDPKCGLGRRGIEWERKGLESVTLIIVRLYDAGSDL